MSTICTCSKSGIKTGFACNYSEGCPYNYLVPDNKVNPSIDPIENRALVNKALSTRKGVSEATEKIALEWESKAATFPAAPRGGS